MTIAIAIFLAFIIGAFGLLSLFLTFDNVVRFEYTKYREAWEADGRPHGFLWRAPECTLFRSTWATHRLTLAWLFKTPFWVSESSVCKKNLVHFRIYFIAWHIVTIGALFLVASSS